MGRLEPENGSESGNGGDYRTARMGAAAALLGIIVFREVGVFFGAENFEAAELTILVGAVIVLLGLQALDLFRKE